MAIAFDQIRDQEDAIHQWAILYEQNKDRGWHREKPHDSADTVRGNINFSKGVAVAGIALLSYFLLKYVRTKSSWMESSETGVNTSWGESLDFDKITKINKRRWEAKGIAKVAYEDTTGRRRTMIFDDFKYDREPMGELITMCEQHVSEDQIVGGNSQAQIIADKESEGAENVEEDEEISPTN